MTQLEYEVEANYGAIVIDDGQFPIDQVDFKAGRPLILHGGMCVLWSGRSDHVVRVEVEVWDGDPPEAWPDPSGPTMGTLGYDAGVMEITARPKGAPSLRFMDMILAGPIPDLPPFEVPSMRLNVQAKVFTADESAWASAADVGQGPLERWSLRFSPA